MKIIRTYKLVYFFPFIPNTFILETQLKVQYENRLEKLLILIFNYWRKQAGRMKDVAFQKENFNWYKQIDSNASMWMYVMYVCGPNRKHYSFSHTSTNFHLNAQICENFHSKHSSGNQSSKMAVQLWKNWWKADFG